MRFRTTRWHDVLKARGNSSEARRTLGELCADYYAPVHAFIDAYTHHDQDARDLTHAFFAKLLEGDSLEHVQAYRGKFRSYLLGAVKHFIADERSRQQTLKRGGAVTFCSLESTEVSFSSASTARHDVPDDAYFDRQWALSILDQSLMQLKAEVDTTASGKHFDSLKVHLVGTETDSSQIDLSRQLGITQESMKGMLHRWRKRFRAIVQTRVAATLQSTQDVEQEIAYLVQCLAAKRSPDSREKS